MRAFGTWCVVGLLVLIVVVGASHRDHDDDDDDDDEECKRITLHSSRRKNDRKRIRDDYGDPADIISVKVIHRYSRVRCRRGRTYYVSRSTVVARRGCRAKFEVCYSDDDDGRRHRHGFRRHWRRGRRRHWRRGRRRHWRRGHRRHWRRGHRRNRYRGHRRSRRHRSADHRPSDCKTVRLLSRVHRRARKNLHRQVSSMRVIRQFHDGRDCKRRRNFGFRGKTVFAHSGCRADFRVCFKRRGRPWTKDEKHRDDRKDRQFPEDRKKHHKKDRDWDK